MLRNRTPELQRRSPTPQVLVICLSNFPIVWGHVAAPWDVPVLLFFSLQKHKPWTITLLALDLLTIALQLLMLRLPASGPSYSVGPLPPSSSGAPATRGTRGGGGGDGGSGGQAFRTEGPAGLLDQMERTIGGQLPVRWCGPRLSLSPPSGVPRSAISGAPERPTRSGAADGADAAPPAGSRPAVLDGLCTDLCQATAFLKHRCCESVSCPSVSVWGPHVAARSGIPLTPC